MRQNILLMQLQNRVQKLLRYVLSLIFELWLFLEQSSLTGAVALVGSLHLAGVMGYGSRQNSIVKKS